MGAESLDMGPLAEINLKSLGSEGGGWGLQFKKKLTREVMV